MQLDSTHSAASVTSDPSPAKSLPRPACKPGVDFLDLPMQWGDGSPLPSWNPQSSALMAPKRNKLGWTVNCHALFSRLGLIKQPDSAASQEELKLLQQPPTPAPY